MKMFTRRIPFSGKKRAVINLDWSNLLKKINTVYFHCADNFCNKKRHKPIQLYKCTGIIQEKTILPEIFIYFCITSGPNLTTTLIKT